MTPLSLRLVGAEVLTPHGLDRTDVSLHGGLITAEAGDGREIDLSGYLVLPGIVDLHGDGFERHLAPRRGAMKDLGSGLIAAEAELAANGITTAVLAQFYSWEGGMRGPEFAERVFEALGRMRSDVATDLRAQLRFEISMMDSYADMRDMVARHGIEYVVFNDHLPHSDLERGKRPKRLTGSALRIGRNPEKHLAYMQELHRHMDQVPAALADLTEELFAAQVKMGSHDDRGSEERERWRARGVRIAEFPETAEAVGAAKTAGEPVIMGAPNVVRGGSHNGNVSAVEQIMMGQVTALASDYHYPSMRRAAKFLEDSGVEDLAGAWALISSGPAGILGLDDRGAIVPGKRADLVVIDAETRSVCATLAAGRMSYMSGDVAVRFVT